MTLALNYDEWTATCQTFTLLNINFNVGKMKALWNGIWNSICIRWERIGLQRFRHSMNYIVGVHKHTDWTLINNRDNWTPRAATQFENYNRYLRCLYKAILEMARFQTFRIHQYNQHGFHNRSLSPVNGNKFRIMKCALFFYFVFSAIFIVADARYPVSNEIIQNKNLSENYSTEIATGKWDYFRWWRTNKNDENTVAI